MIRLTMPTIVRNWPARQAKLVLPGGWDAWIPEAHDLVEGGAYYQSLLTHFVNDGVSVPKAHELTREAIQGRLEYAWKHGISSCVHHWAQRMGETYPWTVKLGDHGLELRGYKPSEMQLYFIPGRPMVKGKHLEARAKLTEFARSQE